MGLNSPDLTDGLCARCGAPCLSGNEAVRCGEFLESARRQFVPEVLERHSKVDENIFEIGLEAP